MFDTLIYIPTILAYTFISLLVVILCFIVVYVSHKVYLNIYDMLPTVDTSKTHYKANASPAVRIYIWIGRSRLAILVLEPNGSPGTHILKYTDSISAIPWNENIITRSSDGVNNKDKTTGSTVRIRNLMSEASFHF